MRAWKQYSASIDSWSRRVIAARTGVGTIHLTPHAGEMRRIIPVAQ